MVRVLLDVGANKTLMSFGHLMRVKRMTMRSLRRLMLSLRKLMLS